MTLRELMVKNHICIGCKSTDAFTLNGRSYCASCAEKVREQRRHEYENPMRRREIREQQKRIYDLRKAAGVCTRCKRPTDGKHATCSICRSLRRGKYLQTYRESVRG